MSQGDYLATPACEQGCPDCVRSCAIAKLKVGAWSDILLRLQQQPPTPSRDADIAEAKRAIAQFSRDIRPPKKLRLIEGGKE